MEIAVLWHSDGIVSTMGNLIALKKYKKKFKFRIVTIDIDTHHSDSYRYRNDCEKIYQQEIEVIKSGYFNNQFEVIEQFRFFNGPSGAKCTTKLKKDVRKKFEYENEIYAQIWGFDNTKREIERAKRLEGDNPNYKHFFPLIEEGIKKENCWYFLENNYGLKVPEMYRLGYHNNNCLGCVKGGKKYWKKIKQDFPDIFNRMAELERKINNGHHVLKECYLDELKIVKGKLITLTPKDTPSCEIYCRAA